MHQRNMTTLPLRLFEMTKSRGINGTLSKRLIYSKLPKLMPPDLNSTLKTFVEFAEPLQTNDKFQRTKQVTKEFVESGEAQKLHELLVERAQNLNNWLTPWWLNIAYLEARTPLPIVTSPGVAFPPMEYSGEEGQIDAAAKMIQAALNFHHKILNNELPEDRAGKVPFDMSQYKFLFGTTRIPRKGKDEIRYGASNKEWPKHILVTRNGHTFQVSVYDKNGNILGTEALEKQFRDFVIPNSQTRNPAPVNLVSSDERDAWAAVYQRLEKKHPELIKSYENALFILCLDSPISHDSSDRSRAEEQMRQMLTGGGADENGINRWFDKTVQLNIGYSGACGVTYEHTPAEGPPIATFIENICEALEKREFYKESSAEIYEKPFKFNFNLDAADDDAIAAAAEKLNRSTMDLEIRFLPFKNFGKNIPKKAKLSPDSFIQMAFQVTHYRLHNILPPTYETATLRKFDEGRTDTIRLPNPASAEFTKAFVDRKENYSSKNLSELFRKAVESHKNYSIRAMMGQGMDRHLLGLRLIAAEKSLSIPKIFNEDAYRKMSHFLVSTSQVPTKYIIPMGFGPSANDCYGICYNPQEEAIHFTITAFNSCKKTSARQFAQELSATLNDFKIMLENSGDLKFESKL
uniref:Choline/carnitine acyltransferase domain-containing protein n=1 Tax=Panagrolaimus davidi TaxID=227884 RepID=A0A914QN05_9BILA